MALHAVHQHVWRGNFEVHSTPPDPRPPRGGTTDVTRCMLGRLGPALLRKQRDMGNALYTLSPHTKARAKRTPRDDCVFCNHYSRRPDLLLYKDEFCAAFRDIRPSAAVHLLIIPREHIHDCSYLRATREDHALTQRMMDVGRKLLLEAAPGAEIKFGYHPPPFYSMVHLHLHCFALPFKPWWKKFKYFEPLSPVTFISGEHMVKSLEPGCLAVEGGENNV